MRPQSLKQRPQSLKQRPQSLTMDTRVQQTGGRARDEAVEPVRGVVRGPKSGLPGAQWGRLDPKSELPGAQWGHLDPKSGLPGTQWGRLGPKSGLPGAQWGHLDPKSGLPGAQWGRVGPHPGRRRSSGAAGPRRLRGRVVRPLGRPVVGAGRPGSSSSSSRGPGGAGRWWSCRRPAGSDRRPAVTVDATGDGAVGVGRGRSLAGGPGSDGDGRFVASRPAGAGDGGPCGREGLFGGGGDGLLGG